MYVPAWVRPSVPSSPVTMRAGRPTVEFVTTWVVEPAMVTETAPLTVVTEMRSSFARARETILREQRSR